MGKGVRTTTFITCEKKLLTNPSLKRDGFTFIHFYATVLRLQEPVGQLLAEYYSLSH